MTVRSICYRGFLGGPRSMGRVGQQLIAHLLARGHYRVHYYPPLEDCVAPFWGADIEALVTRDPAGLDLDQSIAFCSVRNARQERYARLTTSWFYYELSSLPGETVREINTNDAVYVTSTFVQRTFLTQGVGVPTTVLGHGFDPVHYRFFERTREGEFVFLCVAEHTTRKNLPTLVRCFERAFQGHADVRLVLKLGLHGEGGLCRQITRPDRITLSTAMPAAEEEMVALYRAAHCFVLPTRGEGFGMPILEAMATGLPVIVTDYGGHLDFCNQQNAFLIRNRGLVDSDPECFPNIPSQWADPDEDHLVELMRYVYHNYDRSLEVGRQGRRTAEQDWTWQKQLARAFP